MGNNIDIEKINKEMLETLTEAERKAVFSILEEYATSGESKTLEGLINSDYKEIPVDIITFILDDRYLGRAWHDAEGNSKLYPYWETKLRELFPDPYSTSVNNMIISGARGLGKAQPLDSLVLAEQGFIEMGTIKLGDKVYGEDGSLHDVIGIYPQGEKDIYELVFSDGSRARSTDDHLWTVIENNSHYRVKTYTLQEIREKGLFSNVRKDGYVESKFAVPMASPIKFKKQEVFIEPYILGCLLGDGGLSTNTVKFTNKDTDVVNNFRENLHKDYTISKYADDYGYGVIRKKMNHYPNDYVVEIERLKLNTTSPHKFIPKEYLYNDVNTRLSLLQGLMDTDGTISKEGYITLSTSSEQLKDDVIYLVQSLGGNAPWRIKTGRRYTLSNGDVKQGRISYDITIRLPKDMLPFRSQRKLERVRDTRKAPFRTIKEINYVGKEAAQCIRVSNPSHLYLTDEFVVTHNSEISITIIAYLIYRVMCLKNPLNYYRMKPTEKIVFAFMNITKVLAETIGISKFQNTIQMSPWFMEKGSMTQKNNEPYWIPPEPIEIVIGSQSSHVIGKPIFSAFFDEISFIRNQDIDKQKAIAVNMIDTAIGGMKTRFIHGGKNPTLLVLASSKRSEKSFLEEHMKQKLKSESENIMIIDEAVWKVKPEGTYKKELFKVALGNKLLPSLVVKKEDSIKNLMEKGYQIIDIPMDFYPDFLDDIDRALTDFAGISSSEISKYISGARVHKIAKDNMKNPFRQEIIEVGNDPEDTIEYKNFFDMSLIPPEMKSRPLYIHLDMSISGDRTGIGGVWIKGKKTSVDATQQSKDLFYSLAFAVAVKAPKGRQISFEKNRNFIYWLKEQGFNIKGITSDSFQSYDTGQTLKARGYNYKILSVDRVDTDRINKPYQYLKSTIDEERLEIPYIKLLIDELVDLERNINTGKVDHSPNGCFTGDTKVRLTDGRSLTFIELIEEQNTGKTNFVYSFNETKQIIEPKRIIKAWKTMENQPLIKITLDNGEEIRCTLNHKFMLRDGTYIEAQHLIPHDSLMPLYTKVSNNGLKGYRMFYQPMTDKWHYEHREFVEEVDDVKYLVHHKDCNPLNNNPNNLIWMSKGRHQQVHAELQTGAQSKEANQKRADSVRLWHKNMKGTPEYKERLKRQKETNISLLSSSQKENRKKQIERIKDIESMYGVIWENLTTSERLSYGIKYNRAKNPGIVHQIAKNTSKLHQEGRFENAYKALREWNESQRGKPRDPEVIEKIKKTKKENPTIVSEETRRKLSAISSRKRWYNNGEKSIYIDVDSDVPSGFVRGRIKTLKNHKVVSVEFLNKKEDVYDITVEDNHNFALDAGVIVHNSKDLADAIAGAVFRASEDAEQYAYEWGENLEIIQTVNDSMPDQAFREQLVVDFAEEMKKAFDKLHTTQAPQAKQTDDFSHLMGQGIFIP